MHPPASLPLHKIHRAGRPLPPKKVRKEKSQREVGDSVSPRAAPKQRGPARCAKTVPNQRSRDGNRLRAECRQPPEVPADRQSRRNPVRPPLAPLHCSAGAPGKAPAKVSHGRENLVAHPNRHPGRLSSRRPPGWAKPLGTGISPAPGLRPWTPPGEADDCAFLEDP